MHILASGPELQAVRFGYVILDKTFKQLNSVTVLNSQFGEIPTRFPSSPATKFGRKPVSF